MSLPGFSRLQSGLIRLAQTGRDIFYSERFGYRTTQEHRLANIAETAGLCESIDEGEEDAEEKFIVMNYGKKMTLRKAKEKPKKNNALYCADESSRLNRPYQGIDKEESFLEKRRKLLTFPKNIL